MKIKILQVLIFSLLCIGIASSIEIGGESVCPNGYGIYTYNSTWECAKDPNGTHIINATHGYYEELTSNIIYTIPKTTNLNGVNIKLRNSLAYSPYYWELRVNRYGHFNIYATTGIQAMLIVPQNGETHFASNVYAQKFIAQDSNLEQGINTNDISMAIDLYRDGECESFTDNTIPHLEKYTIICKKGKEDDIPLYLPFCDRFTNKQRLNIKNMDYNTISLYPQNDDYIEEQTNAVILYPSHSIMIQCSEKNGWYILGSHRP